MAATSISVARILELRVTISWQEAVAVATAAETECGAHGTPITPENCLISTSGELWLAQEVRCRPGESLSPMQLLKAMLDGRSLPADLKALLTTADDPLASFPSEQDAGGRLRFDLGAFVRPNPASEIAQLAARALSADAQATPTSSTGRRQVAAAPSAMSDFDRWQVDASPPPNLAVVMPPPATEDLIPAPPPAPVVPVWRKGLAWNPPVAPRVAVGVAAVIVILAIGAMALWLVGSAGRTEPDVEHAADENAAPVPAVENPEPAPAGVVAADVSGPGSPTATPSGAPVGTNTPPSSPSASSTAQVRSGPVAASTTGGPSMRSAPAATAVVRTPPVASASTRSSTPAPRPPALEGDLDAVPAVAAPPVTLRPVPVGPAPSTAGPVASSAEAPRLAAGSAPRGAVPTSELRVYSSEDGGVKPPVPVRPHLPSEPRLDSEQSGSYLELVIDEHGQVQQVRLQHPASSLNDRMLLAAAKAWQFRPATRDGQPVPYLLRVPVTR